MFAIDVALIAEIDSRFAIKLQNIFIKSWGYYEMLIIAS